MYGFRKPFTAAEFAGDAWQGVGLKTALVVSQVLGYMVSKFLGVKIIAEMTPARRARSILLLIAWAEIALALFAIAPPPLNIICLFLNGLPLGMVFGLVLGFLEGRRSTEALTAGLCASFIIADGFTKSVGAELLERGVSERAMPALAGLLFVLPLLGFVWMLTRIPPPSAADLANRAPRTPMNRSERRAFFFRYGMGLSLLIAVYLLITILRSMRADYAPEIWKGLGVAGQPSIFTRSEIWVALGVIAVNGAAALIANNRRAFFFALGVSLVGVLLIGLALVGLREQWLDGFLFMVLLGLGLYLPYVAVHTTIFERLIAMTRDRGNIGFLMYLADAIGYLGYVGVLLARGLFPASEGFLNFFLAAGWAIGVACAALLIGCAWAFRATGASTPT
jgi:Na+-transporting NADH:ubiquinone oxidoreductase subunit NqrE